MTFQTKKQNVPMNKPSEFSLPYPLTFYEGKLH